MKCPKCGSTDTWVHSMKQNNTYKGCYKCGHKYIISNKKDFSMFNSTNNLTGSDAENPIKK